MAKLNSISVVPRHNRPGTLTKNLLELQFMINGVYTNPYEVCSVHIVKNASADSPDAYLIRDSSSTSYGLITTQTMNTSADMIFTSSGTLGPAVQAPANAAFNTSHYDGTARESSGIFRTDTGKFAVVLQPNASYWAASATYNPANLSNSATNSASSTGKYFDIWTIVDVEGASPATYINTFELKRDNVVTTTEPLTFTTSHKLKQKYVDLSAVIQLEMGTDHVVHNRNISNEMKNLFTDSIITDAGLEITKVTEDGRFTVSSVHDTSSNVNINSADTILYLWDTKDLSSFNNTYGFGGQRGVYEIRARYTVLNETRYSDRFKLVVR